MIADLLKTHSELICALTLMVAAPADLCLIVCAINRWQRAEYHVAFGGSSLSRRRERLHRRLAALYALGFIVITSLASIPFLYLR